MRLRGPRQVIGARDHASFVARHAEHAAQVGLPVHHRAEAVAAYANHGRWIVDCPHCTAGISVDRDWPDARCLDCGAVFAQVLWPADLDAIETLLTVRPLQHQNWRPGESLDMLRADNLDHRVGGGRA